MIRLASLPQTLALTSESALRAKLGSLSGSNAVAVGWLPELRFLVGGDAVRLYGRVGLIVLADQDPGSAEQIGEAIRADEWLNGLASARIEPLVLPRQWPNLVEAWFGVEQLTLDRSSAEQT